MMPWLERWSPNGEWILALALVAEAAFFSVVAHNFFTVANFFEITRLSIELGLLAVALTPVIVSGGIDLSVGVDDGTLGCRVRRRGARLAHRDSDRGRARADRGMPWRRDECAGSCRGWRFRRSIVTLGSLSLFRGIAEGLTRGAVNYTGFPRSFLALGQGYLFGVVPAQLPLFVLVVAAYVVMLHRSVIGRALYAIGFTAAGARYAGIPVERRVGFVYLLSGLMASMAAIIYVAHLGQARSDAGSGYELDAITAVVLGGTSVFGGRGTLWGTLLGLFALTVLRNGLQLAALPSELAGVLTGTLLLVTIAIDRARTRIVRRRARRCGGDRREKQPGCRALRSHHRGIVDRCRHERVARALGRVAAPGIGGRANAGVSHQATRRRHDAEGEGDPYFISCRAGAEEAARELGVDLIWDGPTSLDAARQNELVENWITRGVDVIAVAVENRGGISSVLRKARARGIRVLTWDADAEPDARDFFVNQATPEGIATTLTDEAARLLGGTWRVRDHHRRTQRRESERVDRQHQEAARRQVS